MTQDRPDPSLNTADLRLLIVEDSLDDADLLLLELRREGFSIVQNARVETPEGMRRELEEGEWDLIISDHKMPSFSAFQALEILKEQRVDIPFIIVSGAIGENRAVEAMRAGAHDYILKGNLARLVPAINRELREADQRRRRRRAEQAGIRFNERLGILHDIDRAILAAHSTEEIATSALERLGPLLGSSQSLLLLTDRMVATRATVLAEMEWTSEEPISLFRDLQLDISSIFADLHQGRAFWSGDSAESMEEVLRQLPRTVINAEVLLTPIVHESRLLGLLVNVESADRSFSEEQFEVAGDVANQLGVALQQAFLVEQIGQHAEELETRVSERTQELQDANEELEAFTYSVSHDLRAPLRSIRLHTAALREKFGHIVEESGGAELDQIVDGTNRMERLIRDLLTYSQLRHQTLRLWPVSLSGTVSALVDRIQPELAAIGGTLAVEDALPRITGDQEIVSTILDAILDNALRYRAPDRPLQIDITAESRSGSTRLLVRDNGTGIAPEMHERAFKIFEKGESDEQRSGNGIGLAIVRKGIERMGGTCGIRSDGKSGSTVWLEWPQKPMRYP